MRAFPSINLHSGRIGIREAVLLVVTLMIAWNAALAQLGSPFNERDDKYRILGLKRAKEAYDVAKSDYARQQELHRKGLITDVELERARSVFADAEVNYQQSLLAVLFEQQYITVKSAVKSYAEDGSRHVKLTVANTSQGGAEYEQLLDAGDELLRALHPDVIHNVYVSLLNESGEIISQPYEAKIQQLRYGEPQTIDFTLLQDLDAVTVFIVYANGSTRSMSIYLQKDASRNRVAMQSEQFSQEVELGKSASYDLTLELFSGDANQFALDVVGLPRQISRYFKDSGSQARLSQVKFTESINTKKATLEITLPDRASDDVRTDQPISFFAIVYPRSAAEVVERLNTDSLTEKALQAADIGYVRLELVPRGKGELRVRAPQLYHAIDDDETVEMYVDLVNEGSHRIDNLEIKADMPLGWTREIDPEVVDQLNVGGEHRINLRFTPTEDVAVGKYEVRLRTSGISDGQPVLGEDKTITVEVLQRANLFGTLALVIFILGIVGGIVVFGVKMSRR